MRDADNLFSFIYGGSTNQSWDWSNPDADTFLTTYALSLPAFRWFKSNSTTPVRRACHTCQLIGNGQMISIGGYQVSDHGQFGAAPDPWLNGIGVFDMSAFAWADWYNAAAEPYSQPAVVKHYYENDYVEPTWTDPVLSKTFQYTPPSKPVTPTPPAPHPTKNSSSNLGPIVGGVVGGVGGVLLLGALIGFVIMRSRKQRRLRPGAKEENPAYEPYTQRRQSGPGGAVAAGHYPQQGYDGHQTQYAGNPHMMQQPMMAQHPYGVGPTRYSYSPIPSLGPQGDKNGPQVYEAYDPNYQPRSELVGETVGAELPGQSTFKGANVIARPTSGNWFPEGGAPRSYSTGSYPGVRPSSLMDEIAASTTPTTTTAVNEVERMSSTLSGGSDSNLGGIRRKPIGDGKPSELPS